MLTVVSNYGNMVNALPSFLLSVCMHTAEFSCYAHKEFNNLCGIVTCTQNTRKHKILHKNSTQGEESNLRQSSFTHKQSIQKTHHRFASHSNKHALLCPWHHQRESTQRSIRQEQSQARIGIKREKRQHHNATNKKEG